VPVPEMTYNVFSGTLNPTHFTLLICAGFRQPAQRQQVSESSMQ